MDMIWEDIHAARPWGKYPAEDLIRTVMRAYRAPEARKACRALELGCGAGANLSFLLAEGFQITGIDGAPSAIAKARARLKPLCAPGQQLELRVETFEALDEPPASQDLIVDYFAVYANPAPVIRETYAKARRILSPDGHFYARVWGAATYGANSGEQIEPGTSRNPEAGPCHNMGLSHFFTRSELAALFADWREVRITRVLTETDTPEGTIEEFTVWARA